MVLFRNGRGTARVAMADRYAEIGNSIAYSKSPAIHAALECRSNRRVASFLVCRRPRLLTEVELSELRVPG
jgi:hypothetical protein